MHNSPPITNRPIGAPGPSLAVSFLAAVAFLIGVLAFVAAVAFHPLGHGDSTFMFVMSVPFLVGGMGGLYSQWKKRADRPRPVVLFQRGARLAVRLPGDRDSFLGIIGNWAVILIWNGVMALMIAGLVQTYLKEGRTGTFWIATAIVSPCVLIGLALAVLALIGTVYTVLTAVRVTRPLLEVSAYPLRLGQTYDVFLSQPGALRLRGLRVLLVCRTTQVEGVGEDAIDKTVTAHEAELLRHGDLVIHHGKPFRARFALTIPAEARPSCGAKHQEIVWQLLVKGELSRWPDFEFPFSLAVTN
jgi:hypothetical protein